MRWCAYLLLIGVVVAGTAPNCEAQLFGGKKNKTPPQQRVPELITIVQTDKDNHKRADAAEELRQYDPTQFTEIVPILVDVLQNDSNAGVRIEAATSLGRLRPISVQAGQALEKATSDGNLWVRIQARTSLTYYQLSGYHAPKSTDPPVGPALKGGNTAEPPLAVGQSDQWWKQGQPPSTQVYRPLPSGPPLAPAQVPVVTAPVLTQPPQGPTIQTSPPPPAPNAGPWVPVQEGGPSLAPPR